MIGQPAGMGACRGQPFGGRRARRQVGLSWLQHRVERCGAAANL
jgi:hypothetical protein